MLRKRYKKKSMKGVHKIFIFFAFLLISFIFILYRFSLLSIKKINLETQNISCASEIQLKELSDLLNKNFFTINHETVNTNIKSKFICVKDVKLLRKFPDGINMKIKGREPAAILAELNKEVSSSFYIQNVSTPSSQLNGNYFVVDDEGVVFSEEVNNLDVPKIYLKDFKISIGIKLSDVVTKSLYILAKVKTYGIDFKKNIIIDNLFIINPDTEKPKIIFSLNNEINIQLASLQLILDKAKIDLKELEFIDLRFDKPVVKFVSEK